VDDVLHHPAHPYTRALGAVPCPSPTPRRRAPSRRPVVGEVPSPRKPAARLAGSTPRCPIAVARAVPDRGRRLLLDLGPGPPPNRRAGLPNPRHPGPWR